MARHFTAQVAGLESLDYWERLSNLGLYSQERRRERYQIIYIWKVSQLLVKGYSLPFKYNPRLGRLVEVPLLDSTCPAAVKNAHSASLRVKGAKLFNIIPKEIRDLNEVTVETFKANLDQWLNTIPDQPTVAGRQRSAATNSLLDQVTMQSRQFVTHLIADSYLLG